MSSMFMIPDTSEDDIPGEALAAFRAGDFRFILDRLP